MLKKFVWVFLALGMLISLLINHTLGEVREHALTGAPLDFIAFWGDEILSRLATEPTVASATLFGNRLIFGYVTIGAILLALLYLPNASGSELAARPARAMQAVAIFGGIGLVMVAGVVWMLCNVGVLANPLRALFQ